MKLTVKQKIEIKKIGEKYNLRFIIIHGSYAVGEERKGSDLDVAVYGKEKIDFKRHIKMYGDFANVFGDNKGRELDLKILHNTNPLFRYEVVRNGQLIYGNQNDFDEYYLYACKDYNDSKSLFKLQDILINKRQKHLNKVLAQYA
ncbi:nucleotidyltransferase domain-containing protein [Patescibacteria group bacterium]|nr:nucleotidyltransferase domain-containing protein [Candidatus Falkowbacteria bacterium]MBU3905826.1 nucleotidyltransferase domain-containing protein [Patescibacteria group bacterium]MBU4014897.1 nucleotidyltransferase domain-containing protein [Patescibacteria group bacterium]MBU4026674.1 nucleotidyltransferase domain-containing protein [Patescibacteria group bacterium]MBU4072947.1 nucleotidyltransferase domain-containing protein [Patescibacteria group bacterium]